MVKDSPLPEDTLAAAAEQLGQVMREMEAALREAMETLLQAIDVLTTDVLPGAIEQAVDIVRQVLKQMRAESSRHRRPPRLLRLPDRLPADIVPAYRSRAPPAKTILTTGKGMPGCVPGIIAHKNGKAGTNNL